MIPEALMECNNETKNKRFAKMFLKLTKMRKLVETEMKAR